MEPVLFLTLVFLLHAAHGETQTGSCKDMLQGYLTGQLSSALGANQVEALRQEFKSFTEDFMKKFKEDEGKEHRKIIYTRWGKNSCPCNATLVYSGYAGGSNHLNSGAAVELLCLPKDPEWGIYTDGYNGAKAFVYGTEYETNTSPDHLSSFQNHDVPCAVCLVPNRSVVKMFPARKSCYKGWNLDYWGYLMAGYYGHPAATKYTCVDESPDTIPGGHANKDGYLLYYVESSCGSLKCPPYVKGRELVCVVCSKT